MSDSLATSETRLQFDGWSAVYDEQPNPMLALETRILKPLLPSIRGCSVLDLGCGTGRWSAVLAAREASAIVGIDSSAQMLSRAAIHVGCSAYLLLADATAMPLRSHRFDIAIGSFMVSHVQNLEKVLIEVWRVLRPGAEFFISDIHPETSNLLQWKRGFISGAREVSLPTVSRSITELETETRRCGFEISARIEPLFGTPEREILRRAGKADVIRSCSGRPPIYILRLRKPAIAAPVVRTSKLRDSFRLSGGDVAFSSNVARPCSVSISRGRIQQITHSSSRLRADIDLSGYLLLPGLINAHDHLDFALFPRMGNGPYSSASEWAKDIHNQFADEIATQRKVPRSVRLWWGAIRNLLAGVTTVCHHNPYEPDFSDPEFPVRVLRDYRWAHSLFFEEDVFERFQSGSPDTPFIIHLGEGTTSRCRRELALLSSLGALNSSTVVVHGLALDQRDASLLNYRRAALIWCPSSADFLFRYPQDADFIRSIQRVALGTDSPLTANGDLLDELNFAHQRMGFSAPELFRNVTLFSSDVLKLSDGEGSLLEGAIADLVAIRNRGLSPAESLIRSSFREVELVLLGGRIQLLSTTLHDRMPRELTSKLEAVEIEGTVRWVRAPMQRLLDEAHKILGPTVSIAGKRVCHGYC
ncbi:MAG TPA: methyltransferase domain-containing protein [Terriglobales bacterium]|nr:methyltransferase domain-containing protein [Terriglobales bacterium]